MCVAWWVAGSTPASCNNSMSQYEYNYLSGTLINHNKEKIMAIWDIENPSEAAREAKSAGNGGQKVIHPGAYHTKFLEMAPGKTQKGEDKWTIKWEFIDGESPDQKKDSVGAKRTQHFTVGSKNADFRDEARKDFLFTLALLGIDVATLNNDGDLFMAGKTLESQSPVIVQYITPQKKDPKYLNFYPKGLLSQDLESATDVDGKALTKWGEATGNESQPQVTKEAAPAYDSEALGL